MRNLIEKYQALGLKPIPLRPRDKLPKLKGGRQRIRRTSSTVDDNIGCVLGDMVDIDCDWPRVGAYVGYLVRRDMVFGRVSNPIAHFIVKAPGTKSVKFICPKSLHGRITLPDAHATCIVELRSGNCYTMFPGSVHPSGEPIEFTEHNGEVYDREPSTYEPGELRALVGIAAMMVILEATWPGEGARQDAAGAVAGVLRKYAQVSEEACLAIMRPNIQDGPERKQRERFITDTYKSDISKISGWNKLKEVFAFEDDVIAAFKSWLATPKPSDGGEGNSLQC